MKKLILSLLTFGIFCQTTYTHYTKNIKTTENEREDNKMYYFPDENQRHKGTWLIWPHGNTYGESYSKSIEYIWIEMTKALANDEEVNIVVWDKPLENRVSKLLKDHNVNTKNVKYIIGKSNDVWVRDTGPMFVYDENGNLVIANFAFDGWGKKTKYNYDDDVPKVAAKNRNIPIIDIDSFILEGGSVEISEDGTVMATKSSVISKNRNPNMSQEEAEHYLKKYMGAKNFIWLEGVTDEDITDAHIDGFARFYDKNTILTVPKSDFLELYENIQEEDYNILKSAKNTAGKKYNIIEMPLTSKNVKGLDYKGSYLNYYIGNKVILLPVYGDKNDILTVEKIQKLYPDKKIVPINVVPLYKYGGMIHCVTQQEPFSKLGSLNE